MKTTMQRWDNSQLPLTTTGVAKEYQQYLPSHFRVPAGHLLRLFSEDPAKAKKWEQGYRVREFADSEDYRLWAQFVALFMKGSRKGDSSNRENRALDSFIASESACKRANRRLRWYGARPERENPVYRVVLSRARGIISQVLGNFTDRTLEYIIDAARPGPGTTIGARTRNRVSLPFKLGEASLAVTPRALPYARMLVETSSRWVLEHADIDWSKQTFTVPYQFTGWNKVAFVPKDATTDRTIAVEPHLNVMLQLGVDAWMRMRLKGFGIDLDDQRPNQRAALKGSVCWESWNPLVTLDLASASDTVSQGVVERLLPTTWREFLDELRCSHYRLRGGDPVEYQKWSSMGNGYTFALESVIFYGLAKACSSLVSDSSEVLVYGDDIAVRRSTAALLMEVFRYVGFRCNIAKTNIFGPFRESCGVDVWAGSVVTPCYLRGISQLRPTDLFRLVNRNVVTERYALRQLQGRRIPYGLPSSNDSGCIWSRDIVGLRRNRHIRWIPDLQAYRQWEFQYIGNSQRIPSRWNFLAALFGATRQGGVEVGSAGVGKAAYNGRGKWCPKLVVAG